MHEPFTKRARVEKAECGDTLDTDHLNMKLHPFCESTENMNHDGRSQSRSTSNDTDEDDDEEHDAQREARNAHNVTLIRDIARAVVDSDAVMILAGAGFTAGSKRADGSLLPDYRTVVDFSVQYPTLASQGWSYRKLATPTAFKLHPKTAWSFYGSRMQMYKNATPHLGYTRLLRMVKCKPYFVYTSNVDGLFAKAGFDGDRIVECHGSLAKLQCLAHVKHGLWATRKQVGFSFSDAHMCTPLPPCRAHRCQSIARPGVLLFNDSEFNTKGVERQLKLFQQWMEQHRQQHHQLHDQQHHQQQNHRQEQQQQQPQPQPHHQQRQPQPHQQQQPQQQSLTVDATTTTPLHVPPPPTTTATWLPPTTATWLPPTTPTPLLPPTTTPPQTLTTTPPQPPTTKATPPLPPTPTTPPPPTTTPPTIRSPPIPPTTLLPLPPTTPLPTTLLPPTTTLPPTPEAVMTTPTTSVTEMPVVSSSPTIKTTTSTPIEPITTAITAPTTTTTTETITTATPTTIEPTTPTTITPTPTETITPFVTTPTRLPTTHTPAPALATTSTTTLPPKITTPSTPPPPHPQRTLSPPFISTLPISRRRRKLVLLEFGAGVAVRTVREMTYSTYMDAVSMECDVFAVRVNPLADNAREKANANVIGMSQLMMNAEEALGLIEQEMNRIASPAAVSISTSTSPQTHVQSSS